MRKSLFLLTFLIGLISLAQGQTGVVTGKVIDAETSEPLELVNIYVNRTTIGTATSMDGTFTLSVPAGNAEMIWSRIGYKTQKVTVTVSGNQVQEITIKLAAEQTSLGEITISAKDDKEWEKNFNQFRKVFFGKDEIADKCIIVNKEVVDFAPAKEGNGFTATASAPLEIINPLLGYKLKYELVNFKYSRQAYTIAGNIQYENLIAEDEAVTNHWNINRQTAYRNSVRGFLKSVIDNTLKEDGYEVFAEKIYTKILDRTSLFSYFRPYLNTFDRAIHLKDTSNGDFVLHAPTRLEIHDTRNRKGATYRDVRYAVSWIELTKPLHISREGVIYNQGAIQVVGHYSNFRVAHLLPQNYVPGEISKSPSAITPSLLTEQIYMHTDRDYYYPGDPIWFKGYMHYGSVHRADSMSRVVYIELIDSAKRIIVRKTLPVEYGTFDGQIVVPASIEKSNLTLRAYTQWMRNFEKSSFLKSIPVLDPYERVVLNFESERKASPYTVVAKASKDTYHAGDEIELAFHLLDASGDTLAGDLSVSVTDYDIVKQIKDPAPIDEAFARSPTFISNKFKIEKGITVEGYFTDNKRKITDPVAITAVIGQLADMTTFNSDNDGHFYISGFYFNDSSSVSLQALNKKKKPFGEFTVVPTPYAEVTELAELVRPMVNRTYTAMPKSISSDGDGGVLLKEVTVTAKREKPYKDMYSTGEISMSGDRIRELNPVDLMSIFRGRIPRVKVIWQMNDMGILEEFLWIPGVGIPMVVIDGMPVEGETAMRMVKSINVRDVERIEVMTGASASVYGSRGANGIVIIMTRTQHAAFTGAGDPTKFSNRDFSSFPIRGFSSFKPFQQNSAEESIGASTIYWNPYILLNANQATKVSFKATVRASKYLVSVKGFTRDGEAVSGKTIIVLQQ